jgi:large subunit ribosomal protein L32
LITTILPIHKSVENTKQSEEPAPNWTSYFLKTLFKEVGRMAVPFRRTSKTAKRKRRTHFKLNVPGMVSCPNCGEMKLAHRVCKACGTYKGKEVVND